MKQRPFIGAGAAAAFAGTAAPCCWAQDAGVKRVGWLGAFAPDNPTSVAIDAFYDDQLKRLGWQRGRNLVSLHRHGPRDAKGWDTAARELVDAGVDVIVTFHDTLLGAAARATRSIPIVALCGAIVEYGFAQSLARPGGNVIGVVSQSHEFSGRVFALLGDIRPGLQRIGVPAEPADRGLEVWFDSVEAAAAGTGMRVVALPLPRAPADIAPMLDAAAREQVQALRMWFLPVQQSTRFELIVHLGFAQILGMTIPQSVLLQASEVIQ